MFVLRNLKIRFVLNESNNERKHQWGKCSQLD